MVGMWMAGMVHECNTPASSCEQHDSGWGLVPPWAPCGNHPCLGQGGHTRATTVERNIQEPAVRDKQRNLSWSSWSYCQDGKSASTPERAVSNLAIASYFTKDYLLLHLQGLQITWQGQAAFNKNTICKKGLHQGAASSSKRDFYLSALEASNLVSWDVYVHRSQESWFSQN